MSVRKLSLRALPITFLVFVIEAALAVLASFPSGVELAPRLSALADASFAQAAALDPARLGELGVLARGLARGHALALLALLALSPWLQMSWLSALSEPQSPLRALARGARSMPRAWLIAVGLGFAFALCALPFACLSWACARWLGAQPDAQRADLTVLSALLPLLPLAFYFHVALDLARASALEQRALRSMRHALRSALRAQAWGPALIAFVVGVGLPAAAHAGSWRLGPWSATIVLQSALLSRLIVRSAWLGHALGFVRARASHPLSTHVERKYDE